MNKKYFYQRGVAVLPVIIIIAVVAILAGVAIPKFLSITNEAKQASEKADVGDKTMTSPSASPTTSPDVVAGTEQPSTETATPAALPAVKEFTMTAYYDSTGKYFSLKEMAVKKGDRVRVKVTNTKGMHDFSLDEYGIKKELPMNQEVVIEFTADKAGEFVYYCSMPGHRAGGQWGTLKVTQ